MPDPVSGAAPGGVTDAAPSPPSEQKADADDRFDLGVLFVHGIGDQQQGATLLQFGEPVIETLRRWYMGPKGKSVDVVRVVRSVLLPAKNFSTDPAHSVVEFDLPDNEKKRWLLAEDWWGDQVVVPNSREFMTWMLTRGSWVVLLHLVERLMDEGRPTQQGRVLWWLLTSRLTPASIRTRILAAEVNQPRLVAAARALYGRTRVPLLWTAIALLVQIPLLLGYILTLVPIPSLSRWVTALVRRVTSVLGDSFVLVKLESQRSAILTHFSKSLEFVGHRSKLVAVVAHSQGTAVVCEVLRVTPTLRPRLLVTFGAGIAKLDQLYLAEATRRLSLTLAGFAPVTAATVALLVPVRGWMDFTLWLTLVSAGAIAWFGLTSYILLHIIASRGDLHAHYLSSAAVAPLAHNQANRTGLRLADQWVDFYASHDPVPTSSLRTTFDQYLGLLHPEPIRNRLSFVTDHTTYFGNFAQFVLPLCRLLTTYGGTPQPLPQGTPGDDALVRHHTRMVWLLSLSFWITLLAVPVSALFFWPVFETWGTAIWSSLGWGWVPDWLRALATWVWPSRLIASFSVTPAQWKGVLAVTIGMIATLLYRRVFGEIWEWWNLQSMESCVQHRRVLNGSLAFAQLLWLALLAAIPLGALGLLLWIASWRG